MTVFCRKLSAMLAAFAVSGGVLAAPVVAAPLAPAAETAQASPEAPETQLFAYPRLYLLQGETDAFAPLREDLPAGTALTLDEGEALAALRAEGWTVSVADSVLTVTAPRHAEGDYEIPVVVAFPDQTTQATSLPVFVDYLADVPLSVWAPVFASLQLAQSSTSSTMP